MAEFGTPSTQPDGLGRLPVSGQDEVQRIPKVSQEALAEMVGTTRSRVSPS